MVMQMVVMVIQVGCHGDGNGSSTRTHTLHTFVIQSLNTCQTQGLSRLAASRCLILYLMKKVSRFSFNGSFCWISMVIRMSTRSLATKVPPNRTRIFVRDSNGTLVLSNAMVTIQVSLSMRNTLYADQFDTRHSFSRNPTESCRKQQCSLQRYLEW